MKPNLSTFLTYSPSTVCKGKLFVTLVTFFQDEKTFCISCLYKQWLGFDPLLWQA